MQIHDYSKFSSYNFDFVMNEILQHSNGFYTLLNINTHSFQHCC